MAADGYSVVFNAGDINRALRRLVPEVQKATRREMAGVARWGRDEIRSDVQAGVKTSTAAGGRAFRAVTSGTRGLVPTVKLNRAYQPQTGWIYFGGRRRRYYRSSGTYRVDRQARQVPGDGGWFYEGIARTRPEAVKRARAVLDDAIRKAGLD